MVTQTQRLGRVVVVALLKKVAKHAFTCCYSSWGFFLGRVTDDPSCI